MPGHSKGIGYRQGQSLKNVKSDHLWNAVLLGGQWFLLDACWGAGRVDMEHESFVKRLERSWSLMFLFMELKTSCSQTCCLPLLPPPRRFDDFYFLTDPEEFIYTHFPDEEQWQLLEAPIPLEEFEKRVFKTSAFFNMGLRLLHPPHAHVLTGRPPLPPPAAGSASLTSALASLRRRRGGQRLPGLPQAHDLHP